MPPTKRIKHAHPELSLLLFRLGAGLRYGRVGRAVQDVLPVEGALAQRGVALGAVLAGGGGRGGDAGDAVLQGVEVGEEGGDAEAAGFVYCVVLGYLCVEGGMDVSDG
jgi:hypothetical protein